MRKVRLVWAWKCGAESLEFLKIKKIKCMYFNFKVAKELYDLDPIEVLYLLLIRQSTTEPSYADLANDLGIDAARVLLYIDLNKKGQKRLNKEGTNVLENLKFVRSTKEDVVIADYLAKEYEKMDKQVGNKKQLIENIALFKKHSSFEAKGLFILIQEFLKDDTLLEYSKRADYLISKPMRFENKFDINGSVLYQFYLRNKMRIDEKIESL